MTQGATTVCWCPSTQPTFGRPLGATNSIHPGTGQGLACSTKGPATSTPTTLTSRTQLTYRALAAFLPAAGVMTAFDCQHVCPTSIQTCLVLLQRAASSTDVHSCEPGPRTVTLEMRYPALPAMSRTEGEVSTCRQVRAGAQRAL